MRWGKSSFTFFHMENNTIIMNNNTRINCVSCTHNCKPTFAPLCMYICVYIHTHIATYVYMCVCIHIYICMEERERDYLKFKFN